MAFLVPERRLGLGRIGKDRLDSRLLEEAMLAGKLRKPGALFELRIAF